jgi:hypothetical protein
VDARIEEIVNRHTKTEETDTQKEETADKVETTDIDYRNIRKDAFIKLDKNLIRVLRA